MKKNNTIIISEDEYTRREEVEKILSRIFKSEDERKDAVHRFSVNEVTDEVLLSMKSLSFFVTKQVFVFSQIDKYKKKQLEVVASYLESPADFTHLILEGESFSGRDALTKKIKESSTSIEPRKQFDSALRGIIFEKVKQHTCRIQPDAVEVLIARVGGSASFLSTALDKIVLAVGPEAEISESVVDDLIEDHASFDVYKLTNAIADRQLEKALAVLDFLISDGSKAIELIGMIAWQFRRFFEAHVMLDQGIAPQEIAKKLRVYGKYLNQFIQHVRSFSDKELSIIINTLLEIDSKAKMSASDTRKEIEVLLVRICRSKLV